MVYSSILILLPAHKLIDFIRHDTTATLACSSTPAPSWNRLAAAVASVCRRAVNSVEVITNNFGQQLDQTSPTNFCLFFFFKPSPRIVPGTSYRPSNWQRCWIAINSRSPTTPTSASIWRRQVNDNNDRKFLTPERNLIYPILLLSSSFSCVMVN